MVASYHVNIYLLSALSEPEEFAVMFIIILHCYTRGTI